VLVMGLGLVGHLAAKVFSACGYNVFTCDPSGARREFALRSGIRRVLPSVSPDDSDLAGQVALVLECSGHEEAAQAGCESNGFRKSAVILNGLLTWSSYQLGWRLQLPAGVFVKFLMAPVASVKRKRSPWPGPCPPAFPT